MNFQKVNFCKITIISMALFILFLIHNQIFAAEIVPNTFSQGEVISASKMNENFTALESAVKNTKLGVFLSNDTFLGYLIDFGDSGDEPITIYNDVIKKFIYIIGTGYPSTANKFAPEYDNFLLFESNDCSGQPYIPLTNQANYSLYVIKETYNPENTPVWTYSYYIPKDSDIYFEQKTILSISVMGNPSRVCNPDGWINPSYPINVIPVESIQISIFDNIPYKGKLVFK